MQMKTLSKRIADYRADIARLEAERERCNAAFAASEYDPTALDELRRRRAEECAQAFIDQRKPNTAEIDKEITAAEKLRAPAMEHASAALGAVNLTEERLTKLRAELAAARAELKVVVAEEIKQRIAKAREEFNAAVDVLRDKLAVVSALNSADATLRGIVSRHSAAQLMIDALRDEGLRVFTDTVPRAPRWLPTFSAAPEYEALAAEFRAAGLDGI